MNNKQLNNPNPKIEIINLTYLLHNQFGNLGIDELTMNMVEMDCV